ncbi:MAG: radical SAM protein, partial [Rhodothermales bacterium]
GRMPNIGIMYLAGVLEDAGYPVVTFDEQYEGTPPLMLASKINAQNPSLVGFTLYDVTMEPTHHTLSLLRLAYDGPIVVGGYTATFHAEDILRAWPEVDYVIVREGETALRALVAHLEGDIPVEEVPNLVYRDGDSIRSNPEAALTDVTTISWPRRQWPESGDVTPIVTRRGCMSRCAFCSMVPFYDLKLGPILRQRAPEDVVDEIAYCVDNGSTEFMIYDDDFGLSSKRERAWCAAFLDCLKERDLDIHWGVELRVADVVRGSELLLDF